MINLLCLNGNNNLEFPQKFLPTVNKITLLHFHREQLWQYLRWRLLLSI